MKTITLIVDGKEIEAHVNEEDLKEIEKKNGFQTEKECADAARVVSLWLRMKRFADEHNERKFDFDNVRTRKFFISYDLGNEELTFFFPSIGIKSAFQIYFDSKETAQKAIYEFHDELMWYFAEYGKDS